MLDTFLELGIFTTKATIIVALILILLAGIIAIISKGKEKLTGRVTIKNLNEKFTETKEDLLEAIKTKEEHKAYLKDQKRLAKERKKANEDPKKNIFVVHFQGDIKASAVTALREEITAILSVATKTDEVVIILESAGGMVHAYGLAAAQLQRVREKNIPLTVIVDKVAASGGYMMAAVANKIIAAPFAILGSIGVIIQIPNFNRFLKEKQIDFEQLTAGSYKRTLTVFGPNTEEGREKLREEIDEIHHLFKQMIQHHRPQLDIEKVATGEHWLGTQALAFNLIDELNTSDDYLVSNSANANIYEIGYHVKRSISQKLTSAANTFKENIIGNQRIF